jgi:CHAT domain-containing protein
VLQNQGGKLLVAHLTTHSTFDVDDYLQSQIMFGDEPLTLFELISNPAYDFSGMRLFYLSSCESGMSRTEAGDELQGLVWALVTAGTNAVMATLWEAEDRVSHLMSGAFYDVWQAGGTLAEAHAAAVRHILEESGLPNSYFWAPFVLFGDGWSTEGTLL